MKIINHVSATDPRRSAPGRRQRPPGRVMLLIGAALAAASIAACGGSSSGSGVAQINTSTAASTSAQSPTKASRVAFAQCMRTHGEPNFPDTPSTGGPAPLPQSVNPNSPTFHAAEHACKSLEPTGVVSASQSSKAMAAALRFATCMQNNGVPNYPDPKTRNNGTAIQQGIGSGVNANSPTFKRAQNKCGGGQPPTAAGG